MLLLKRDTGGYLECFGTATSTKLCWGYRSTAGGGSIVPHSPLTLSTITYCVQKYLQNVCRAETLFRISDRSHWRCVAREWVGGSWAGRKQAISNNFHGWRRILGLDKKLPVKVGWWQFSTSLQVLSLSNTPGLLLPAQIREITHCYNFLWR